MVPVRRCRQTSTTEDEASCDLQRRLLCAKSKKKRGKKKKVVADSRCRKRQQQQARRCSRLSDQECKRRCRSLRGSDRVLTKCRMGVVCQDPADSRTCREEELCYQKPMVGSKQEEDGHHKV